MVAHDLGGKLLPFRRQRAVVRETDDALLADVAVGETSRVRRFLRTGRLCPARWKIVRAVCDGLDSRMGWHLSGCSECEREYVALRELTARLPTLRRR